jgi:hypothetical protein
MRDIQSGMPETKHPEERKKEYVRGGLFIKSF